MIGVGSKVVCIEVFDGIDQYGDFDGAPMPKKGVTYSVECIETHLGRVWLGLVGFDLSDLFLASRFRELEHEQMRAELEYRREEMQPQPLIQAMGIADAGVKGAKVEEPEAAR